jgi:cytoskeleton protein RodZ
MNQLGPIFREARVRSGKTVEDATRETKIAKKYLIAIENENFDIFPGETYLIGFLRNYAQFLDLDPDEMVQKYKDYKIQEQPAPIEQLTARPKNTRRYVLLVFIAVIIVSALLYVFITGKKEAPEIVKKTDKVADQKKEETDQRKEDTTLFEEEEVIQDFRKGDIIEYSLRDKRFQISIDGVGEKLNFSIQAIPFALVNGERVEIDFDRDGRKDLLMKINRLGEESVNLTLKKLYKSDVLSNEITTKTPVEKEGPPEVVIIREDEELSTLAVAPETGFNILSGYEKTDITVHIDPQSTSYLSYFVDEGNKEESLLKSGDKLTITAKDELKMASANAGALSIEINKIPVTIGEKGETVAKVIRWYRDAENSNLYHLIMDDWEL